MAGTMIHMAVSMHLLDTLKIYPIPENSLAKAYFVAGNVAPDAIQCHKNYERPMKLHTHLRDDIPDLEFHTEKYLAIYHQRLHTFAKEHLSILSNKNSSPDIMKNDAFYYGYFTHLLTDEYFMKTVRQEFMTAAMKDGYSPYKKEIFDVFSFDTNQVDYRLAQTETLLKARDFLKKANGCNFPGMLSKEILEQSRNWVFQTYFSLPHQLDNTKYISLERMQRFIADATNWITAQIEQIYF